MRLSEIYTSVQGEGPGAGLMTQFIRFAGCNLKCPGWPCDTPHAIDPEKYRHEWEKVTPEEVFERTSKYPKRVVFTGGEPHLQPRQELHVLAWMFIDNQIPIEVFTNGTLPFPEWVTHPRVMTIMDWKLPGSGEDFMAENRISNLDRLRTKDAVKFVVGNREDYEVAKDMWYIHLRSRNGLLYNRPQTYVGVAWGRMETAELVEWLKKDELDWKLNVQVHNYIWDRNARGI